VLEHFKPFGREEGEVAVFVAFRAVDGSDLDATETGGGELFELAGEAGFVDAAAGPPPTGPRFVFAGDLGPGGGIGRERRRLSEGGKGEKERRGEQS
jgi:hypothetical protein